MGVLASAGWREVWRPSPKVDPGAFSGQTGMEDPQKDPLAEWRCTACVCSGSALLRDLLTVGRSMQRDLLSVLSYPRFFFIDYCTVLSFIIANLLYLIFLHVLCVGLVVFVLSRFTCTLEWLLFTVCCLLCWQLLQPLTSSSDTSPSVWQQPSCSLMIVYTVIQEQNHQHQQHPPLSASLAAKAWHNATVDVVDLQSFVPAITT